MRYVVVLLVGALIGAMFTVVSLNALQQASAVPRGLMTMMQVHTDAVRADITAGRCTDSASHFQTLRGLAGGIESSFLPTGGDDALFKRYAGQLRDRMDQAVHQPASDCAALTEQIGRVSDGCKACHRDYK